MKYTILENGNYLVELLSENGLPMFIEMTPDQFKSIQP